MTTPKALYYCYKIWETEFVGEDGEGGSRGREENLYTYKTVSQKILLNK